MNNKEYRRHYSSKEEWLKDLKKVKKVMEDAYKKMIMLKLKYKAAKERLVSLREQARKDGVLPGEIRKADKIGKESVEKI